MCQVLCHLPRIEKKKNVKKAKNLVVKGKKKKKNRNFQNYV